MYMWFTVRAQEASDRKKMFELLAIFHDFESKKCQQLARFIYKIRIFNYNANFDEIRKYLQENGQCVLQVTDGKNNPLWTHKKFSQYFTERNWTAKTTKRRRQKDKKTK